MVPSMMQMLLDLPYADYDLGSLVVRVQRRTAAAGAARAGRTGLRRHDPRGLRVHRRHGDRHRLHPRRQPSGQRRQARAVDVWRSSTRWGSRGHRRGRRDLHRGAGRDDGLLAGPGRPRRRSSTGGCTPTTSVTSTRTSSTSSTAPGPDHPRRLQRLPARRGGRAARPPAVTAAAVVGRPDEKSGERSSPSCRSARTRP